MSEEDRGPWIRTFSGGRFYLSNPSAKDVRAEDIAHSLARQCRFVGHLPIESYSIAEHSVIVANRVRMLGGSDDDILWGLLHDAAEAYIGDVSRPMKKLIPEIRQLEARVMNAICARFGLLGSMPEIVKQADEEVIAAEVVALWNIDPSEFGPQSEWMISCTDIPDISFAFWGPDTAKKMFEKEWSDAMHGVLWGT